MQNKIFPLTAGKNGKGKLFRWVVILIGLFLHWQMDVANKVNGLFSHNIL